MKDNRCSFLRGARKMAAVHLAGILLILGLVQGEPILKSNGLAFVEDMRQGSRIVAGWEAQDGQIPHQISLRMVNAIGSVSSCGGSIIHHEWVITAAHCVANRVTFVVRLGLTNLTRPEYLVESTRKYIHPRYNELSSTVQTDDIALVGLDQSIPYGPYIQPCRLQNSGQKNDVYTGVVFTVSGYGRTEDLWNGGAASEILRWVHLRGITNEECRSWYNNSPTIQEQTICAEYYNDTAQSSCQGDSGGPLTFVDADGAPTMVGVVSFGSSAGCNSPFPSAYVRPGHYHDWFYEVTNISFDWSSEDLVPSEESASTEEAASTEEDASTEEEKSSSEENSNEEKSSSEEKPSEEDASNDNEEPSYQPLQLPTASDVPVRTDTQ